jgi:hypothetical protein
MEDDLEIKVKRKLVFAGEASEIDFRKYDYFSTKEEKKKFEYIRTVDIDEGEDESNLMSYEIEIGLMKKMIQEAEDKGANFVSIDYHCDHIGYEVYGLKITRATSEEEAEQEDTEAKKKEDIRLSKIKVLKEKLLKLEK